MRLRQKKGGTLALVAAAIIILIMLGICFFFLAQIFGGEREIQHATDSGSLNVAKHALRSPSVGLNAGVEIDTFGQLGDRNLPCVNGHPPVNLLTYDRLMAQALLMCINANASPGPGNIGITHADAAVAALQGSANSIGGRLTASLSSKDPGTNPLLGNYSETANQNSLRMLGNSSAMNRKDDEWAVAYLENTRVDASALAATNVAVTNLSLIPASLQSSVVTYKNGQPFLKGYVQPSTGSTQTPIGIPMQPGDQPHLVSNRTFASMAAPFSLNPNVPPNGYRSTSFAQESRTQQNARTVACSEVGSLNMTFPMSIPFGYIMVVNAPDGPYTPSVVNGEAVALDHVLNNELLGGGILLAGPVFSTDQGKLNEWAKYNSCQKDGGESYTGSPSPPSVDGVYKLDGTPAKASDMSSMPYSGTGMSAVADSTQCTDRNSTGWTRSDTDVVPACWDALNNGGFDKAYHPDGSYTNPAGDGAGGGGGLLAIECAKCQLQHRFNACTNLTINNGNCPTTGLRTNSGADWRSQEAPSSAASCQISKDDTISNLGNFVQSGFGPQLDSYIAERCKQIAPKDGDTQYRTSMAHNTLVVGQTYYIYADNASTIAPGSSTDPHLVMSTTPPSWLAATVPDGTPDSRHNTYNIVMTAINPHHDRGIHDIMYTETPSSGINGTDTATWTPSSGFGNLLGKVQFTDAASGSAGGFCKPD
jgi:hypothetical protein